MQLPCWCNPQPQQHRFPCTQGYDNWQYKSIWRKTPRWPCVKTAKRLPRYCITFWYPQPTTTTTTTTTLPVKLPQQKRYVSPSFRYPWNVLKSIHLRLPSFVYKGWMDCYHGFYPRKPGTARKYTRFIGNGALGSTDIGRAVVCLAIQSQRVFVQPWRQYTTTVWSSNGRCVSTDEWRRWPTS